MTIPCQLVVAIFLASVPGFVLSQQTDSWVGKQVMTKKSGIRLVQTDDKGRPVFVGQVELFLVTVLAEKDGRLKASEGGVEGWFDKADAVLLENAITYFTQSIKQNSKDAEALHRRAAAWQLSNELANALKDYNEAIRLSPDEAHYWNNRGTLFDDKQEYAKAISDYNEAIRLNPDFAHAYCNRGNTNLKMQEYAKALSDFDDAIRIAPKLPMAHLRRGQYYVVKEDYIKAIADLDEAIKLDSKYTWAYKYRGYAHVNAKHYDKATRDYAEALKLDPQDAWSHNTLAWLLATCPKGSIRNGKKAVEHAIKACEMTKWKEPVYIGTLAATYAEDGQFDSAVKWQTKALEFAEYEKHFGEQARQRLKGYEMKKPHREK